MKPPPRLGPSIRLFLVVLLLSASPFCQAEEAQPQAPAAPAGPPKTLAVLPSTDTSQYGIGAQMQTALMALFAQTQNFTVMQGANPLTGFATADVAKGFAETTTNTMAFAYLENERLSLYLFDSTRPQEFVLVSQALVDPMLGNTVTPQVVEYKLRLNFNQLLTQYYAGQFQPLPGVQGGDAALVANSADDPKSRAEQSRRLFREMASIENGKSYVGASIGMARYSGGPSSASTVNFSAYGGSKVGDRTHLELGLDFFAYSLAYFDVRYQMPLAERYMTMNITFGVGRILGAITPPRFADEARINTGALVFGPGISFDLPLLGAQVRGEFKLYFGAGTILLGSYGITYSI